jgi:hypothetical protein
MKMIRADSQRRLDHMRELAPRQALAPNRGVESCWRAPARRNISPEEDLLVLEKTEAPPSWPEGLCKNLIIR